VSSAYWPAVEFGGPIRSVANLARALACSGAAVEVFAANVRGAPQLPRERPGLRSVGGVEVSYFDGWFARGFVAAPGLAAAVARRRGDWDVVHVQGIWTFVSAAVARVCWLCALPYVVSPRGSLDPWSLGQKKRLYLELVESWTLRRAGLLHFTAADERAAAPEPFRSQRAVVVPNAVDLEVFRQVPRADPRAGVLRLVIAGRIHPKKGFDLLLPAMALARKTGFEVHLEVVGPDEGGYELQVRDMVKGLDLGRQVRFCGAVDREGVAEAFARADAVVMPSYQENFGMSVAEAMAAARPVVVSRAVNLAPDVVAAGAGYVVPLDPAALAGALVELGRSPENRRMMGDRARRHAMGTYSFEAVGRQMVAGYKLVARRRAAGETASFARGAEGDSCGS
jgi:glycosyltransferase involved in cell wall biosynthesis